MILIYSSCLLLLIYYFFVKSNNYWVSKGIPYEKPFLFFGSFLKVALRKQHFMDRVREIYRKYKTPYVGIYIFNQPQLMVRSPELLKKVLVKDFDKFVNRPIASHEHIDPIAFNSLFSARDTTWRNLPPKISPVFSSGKMKMMLPLMKNCSNDLKSYFNEHDGQTIDAKDVFKKFTVDIISSCAFGINSGCLKDDNSEIMEMATLLLDPQSFVRNISIFSLFFFPKLVHIFKLTFTDPTATKYLLGVFDRTMKERKRLNIVRNDLIDLLHNLKKNETFTDNYKFDDVKMGAQAVTFFSAGNDTTAATLGFALYELALNQEVQDRLRQELRENCDENGDFTYEVLQKMKYLDMVLKETLRKYPFVPFLTRETFDNYTFEESGLTLEKGTSVFIPVVGLHYDPEYYPNPERFDPERFNDENKANIIPYTYMPFGDGPRVCIGERFANLVSKLALSYIIKDFVFERTSATPVPLVMEPSTLSLQNKQGLMLKVIKAE